MTERGQLIVLSGPSGVGKDTVLRQLLEQRPDCALSISATTRAPRNEERDGTDYFFKTGEEFRALVDAGKMLEWAEYSGNCYGTPACPVEALRAKGIHVILEIEVLGALQIKKKCPDAIFVFLMPPSIDVLRKRLEKRGTESPQAIEKRIDRAKYEIAKANEYDYIIISNTVEQSCAHLDAVITASKCSAKLFFRKECQDA